MIVCVLCGWVCFSCVNQNAWRFFWACSDDGGGGVLVERKKNDPLTSPLVLPPFCDESSGHAPRVHLPLSPFSHSTPAHKPMGGDKRGYDAGEEKGGDGGRPTLAMPTQAGGGVVCGRTPCPPLRARHARECTHAPRLCAVRAPRGDQTNHFFSTRLFLPFCLFQTPS